MYLLVSDMIMFCTAYGNAYRTTIHSWTLAPANTHTHTHTHTHSCYIDPAIIGNIGRMFFLESSGVQPSHSVWSPPCLRPIFTVGDSQKSLGARSGEYECCVMAGKFVSARNFCTTSDVWLGAETTVPACHLWRRFLRSTLRNLCKNCT
jgi:hypothetical protein